MVIGRSWRLWTFLAGLALTVAMFVLASASSKFPGDEPALLWVQGLQTRWLDGLARGLDVLGDWPVVLALVGGSTAALFIVGRRVDAGMVMVGSLLMAGGQALKLAVGRARPEHVLAGAESSGFGFPSGHSVYAFLFGGLLIYIAGTSIRQPLARRTVQVALAIWVAATGASRVYLGVHWPSDVIGGFMFGAIALTVILTVRNTFISR